MSGLTDDQWNLIQNALSKVDDLMIRMTKLEISILGNGTKGLNERVRDLEKHPPRFSWKQVFVNIIIILSVSGFMSSSFYFSLSDLSAKTARIESKLDTHIITP
jgi:hypothetical protein